MAWGNGKLILYAGRRGTGKTTVALRRMDEYKQGIICVPGLTNPSLLKYPHITDGSMEFNDLQTQLEIYPKIRVDLVDDNPTLFSTLSKLHGTQEKNLPIMIDDLPIIISNPELKKDFVTNLLVKLRWQNLEVICTFHRLNDQDCPRKALVTADEIYWVGSLKDKRESASLHEISGSDLTQDQFDEKLASLKNFDYKHPNYKEAVFNIMNYSDEK